MKLENIDRAKKLADELKLVENAVSDLRLYYKCEVKGFTIELRTTPAPQAGNISRSEVIEAIAEVLATGCDLIESKLHELGVDVPPRESSPSPVHNE